MMDLPELIVLDVGHGNCAILRDTEAITVIDCPPTTTLVETLEALDISAIDHVLISHADIDHAGGLPTLLGKIHVRNVYINPDASKRGTRWAEIRTALAFYNKAGTKVHRALGAEISKQIHSGQVEIEILAPSLEEGLSGAGGEDRNRRALASNSVSAVIGLIHRSHRVAILPGDLDEIGLDNLLKDQNNIEASVLIFPHHGGSAGTTNNLQFAQKLCSMVKPELLIFSFARKHTARNNQSEYPRDDIIKGVRFAIPETHIMCTQLSRKCAPKIPLSDFSHLTTLPARGFDSDSCCGGTIIIKINGKQTTYFPQRSSHHAFISNPTLVPTPLCLLQDHRNEDPITDTLQPAN
ncbi:MAG TPA: MBL fold metallo-hydrolase [Ktedonobacteraceae bacterium]|jgi:competence protein ComEC|nr:MBL fold metallo-hydrolase [Ktedonobacteraceae bacterium]